MDEAFSASFDVSVCEIEERDLDGFRDWYGPSRDAGFLRSYERHKAGEVVYLVAHAGERPVGHLGVDLVRKARMVVLWQFGVLPTMQGRGIGTLMMEQAEDASRERGFRLAEIGAETTNPRARALYERLGYELVDTLDDEWLLRKSLTGPRKVTG